VQKHFVAEMFMPEKAAFVQGAGEIFGLVPELNHLLVLDLEPVLNQENFAEVKMSN
jgi:hypothetical protein